MQLSRNSAGAAARGKAADDASGSFASPGTSAIDSCTMATKLSLGATGVVAGGAGTAGCGSDPLQQHEEPEALPHPASGAHAHENAHVVTSGTHAPTVSGTVPASSSAAATSALGVLMESSLLLDTPASQLTLGCNVTTASRISEANGGALTTSPLGVVEGSDLAPA